MKKPPVVKCLVAIAAGLAMLVASPPAPAHEVDVGKSIPAMPEPQKDYAIGNLATIPALEGLALHAIASQTLAIQDAVPAVVAESASPMAIVNQEACASTTDAGVKAIPVAHATQVAKIAAKCGTIASAGTSVLTCGTS